MKFIVWNNQKFFSIIYLCHGMQLVENAQMDSTEFECKT